MDSQKTNEKDDPWKEIANRAKSTSSKAGPTVQTMVARMNQLWPFSSALGIFDNGCGWGSIISHILEEYGSDIPQTAQIIAGDLSDSMLQAVREKKESNSSSTKIASQNPWTRLSVQNLDAQDLTTIPSSTLSHITAGHLYMLLPNSKLALLESHRVLCPGGITAMTTGKSSQHIDALTSAFESTKPGTNLRLFKEPWNSEEGIKRELEDAGFVDVETHLHGSELKYEDVGEFADMLLLMPVLNDALAGFDEDEKVRLKAKLVENLTAVSSEKRGRLTGVGITTLARKPR